MPVFVKPAKDVLRILKIGELRRVQRDLKINSAEREDLLQQEERILRDLAKNRD